MSLTTCVISIIRIAAFPIGFCQLRSLMLRHRVTQTHYRKIASFTAQDPEPLVEGEEGKSCAVCVDGGRAVQFVFYDRGQLWRKGHTGAPGGGSGGVKGGERDGRKKNE